MKIYFRQSQNTPKVSPPLALSYGRGDGGEGLNSDCRFLIVDLKIADLQSKIENVSPPHPRPFSPEDGGEGREGRRGIVTPTTCNLSVFSHFHKTRRGLALPRRNRRPKAVFDLQINSYFLTIAGLLYRNGRELMVAWTKDLIEYLVALA